jgi:hypothetical protein
MNRAHTFGYWLSLLRIRLLQCFLVRITSRIERFRFCTWTNVLVLWKDPQWRLVLWMVALPGTSCPVDFFDRRIICEMSNKVADQPCGALSHQGGRLRCREL